MLRGRILTFLCVKIQVFRGRLTAKTAASEAVTTENIGTAAPIPLRKEQQGYCPLSPPCARDKNEDPNDRIFGQMVKPY